MKRFISIFVLVLALYNIGVNAQVLDQPRISIGAGAAANVNEAKEWGFKPSFRADFKYPIMDMFTAELGVSYLQAGGKTWYADKEYKTNIIPIDLRLNFAPVTFGDLRPYVFAGVGMVNFSVKDASPLAVKDAKADGTTGMITGGLGLEWAVAKSVALDFAFSGNRTFTDDINGEHDDIYDGWWNMHVGISFALGSSTKEIATEETDTEYDMIANNPSGSLLLEGIEFNTASSDITSQSEKTLNKALKVLNKYPAIEVEIQGHTDNVGNRDNNLALSQKRAESVKNWLVSKGIAESRLSTKGYGPDKPIATNDTPEGKKRNRRIEFFRTK